MHVKESTVFLYGNFELKHVTMVTDLGCFEKLGPDCLLQYFVKSNLRMELHLSILT